MDGDAVLAQVGDEFLEFRVAAYVAAAADGDLVHVPVEHQRGHDGRCDHGEGLEARVLLFYAAGAIIAPFLEREAMFAAEGRDFLY